MPYRRSTNGTASDISVYIGRDGRAGNRSVPVKDIPIIFELVIVGFEVLDWILLLVLALFGYQWIKLNSVTQWATQLSFGLLGLAYMFAGLFKSTPAEG